MHGWHQFGRLVLFASAAGTGAAGAQESTPVPEVQKIEFHLAQQPVGQALTALGQQSGLTVVMESSLARDVMAPAVEGRYTPAEAVRQILAPTGLRAQYLDKKTVVVLASREDTQGGVKSADITGAHAATLSKAADPTTKKSTREPAIAPAPQHHDQTNQKSDVDAQERR
jgi:hypothetical protein